MTQMTNGKLMGRLTKVSRLPNSVNGNPRWGLVLDGWRHLTTAKDTMCAYAVVESDEGKEVVLGLDQSGAVVFYDIPRPSRCEACGELVSRCSGCED